MVKKSQNGFLLQTEHWREMLEHVWEELPIEACGIVAGKNGRSLKVYPVANELHSATGFRMEPKAQVRVLTELDKNGWELLAIYHSHPNGPATPSQIDIAGATYPEAVSLIWSKNGRGWHCLAYQILDGRYEPVAMTVETLESGE